MARRLFAMTVLVVLTLPALAGSASAGAVFLGPGPGLTGNDIGGIIQYTPAIMRHRLYRDIAANWCARWGRLSHVTSVHRRYGDYIGFVCMDRPGMIH
jgi:hypothetical protein